MVISDRIKKIYLVIHRRRIKSYLSHMLNTFPVADGIGLLNIIYIGPIIFAIMSIDANNEYIDLLVNTIGNYEGSLPYDIIG